MREWHSSRGFQVVLYELRPLCEYIRPLHFNPRLIMDTLLRGQVEYTGDEEFKPENYNLVVIGTPVWYDQITPVIKSFAIKWHNRINAPVVFYITSTLNIKYSEISENNLKFSVVKNLEKSREVVKKSIRGNPEDNVTV